MSDYLLYSKGIGNRQPEEVRKVILNGDKFAIESLGSSMAERQPVFPFVHRVYSPDLDLYRRHQPDMPSREKIEIDMGFLYQLAADRDKKLKDVDYNDGYCNLSWFLWDVRVDNYKDNHDYMTDTDSFKHIYAGNNPVEIQAKRGTKKIETLRDLAAYVHNDSPFEQWERAVRMMLEADVPTRGPEWGYWHICGGIGECIRRAWLLSFMGKWETMHARPEEYGFAMDRLLPQAYAEGSPTHPSTDAMHSFAAWVVSTYMLRVFDPYHTLKASGRMVEKEVSLYRDNIGLSRQTAGVHHLVDHDFRSEMAIALGNRIIQEMENAR